MLIMNRRVGEEIVLDTSDGPITISITEVTRSVVNLAIDAPTTVRISRVESMRTYPGHEEQESAQ
jgi:carbon storage regulator CsrA